MVILTNKNSKTAEKILVGQTFLNYKVGTQLVPERRCTKVLIYVDK